LSRDFHRNCLDEAGQKHHNIDIPTAKEKISTMNNENFTPKEKDGAMKKRNLILVLALAAVALLLLFVGLSMRKPAARPPEAIGTTRPVDAGEEIVAPSPAAVEAAKAPPSGTSEETAAPEPVEGVATPSPAAMEGENADPTPRPTLYPANSYLRISTGRGVYAPIPLVEDGSFKLTQGEGIENVIHVGKDSFYMESSTCDNQDCVEQGEVTLDNIEERILFNMVICLPNQVTLELLTPEEAQTALEDMYRAQEEYEDEAALAAEDAYEAQ
jgi:hypothetical protein